MHAVTLSHRLSEGVKPSRALDKRRSYSFLVSASCCLVSLGDLNVSLDETSKTQLTFVVYFFHTDPLLISASTLYSYPVSNPFPAFVSSSSIPQPPSVVVSLDSKLHWRRFLTCISPMTQSEKSTKVHHQQVCTNMRIHPACESQDLPIRAETHLLDFGPFQIQSMVLRPHPVICHMASRLHPPILAQKPNLLRSTKQQSPNLSELMFSSHGKKAQNLERRLREDREFVAV